MRDNGTVPIHVYLIYLTKCLINCRQSRQFALAVQLNVMSTLKNQITESSEN